MAGDQNKFRTAMTHAERFSQQGNWQEANRAYRFALAEFPNHEAAIIGFGKSLMNLGSAEQAWRAFQQVLKINPSNTDALGSVAQIQAKMGQPQAGAQTYVKVGTILASRNRFDEAIQAWRTATEMFPQLPDAHRNIAQALAHLGETRPAARQFLAVAALYQQRKQIPQAAQYIEAARNLLPDDPGVQTAIQALQQGQAVLPDMISETEPEPEPVWEPDPEPELESDLDDFDFPSLMVPDDDTEHDVIGLSGGLSLLMPDEPEEETVEIGNEAENITAEVEEDDPFSEDALADFFDDEPETVIQETPAEDEWDIFGVDDSSAVTTQGGLLEGAREKALSELANIIFEDDQGGPETSVLPDGRQVSRMEINMMVIQAIDLQTREDYDEAIDRYRQVVQANAGRPALFYNLGLLYKEQQEFKEATKLFRMASPDPDYRLSTMFALGQTYYEDQQPEQALRQFTDVLKEIDLDTIDDDRYDELEEFYENFADELLEDESYKKLANFVASLETFFIKPDWHEKAIEARQRMDRIAEDQVMSLAEFLESPETEVVVTALANTNEYLEKDLPHSASEECLRAIQRAPHYLPLHTRLADILFRLEQTDSAIRTYMTVASVYETRRQTEQALGVYKKILKIAPLDVNVRLKLIDTQLNRGKVDAAMENYLSLADAHYQLAQVEKSLERYNEALELTDRTREPNIWKVKIFNQVGDIYNQRFDWAKATAYFEEAYKVNAQDDYTSRQLIDLYYKQGKTAPAIRVLDTLLKTYYGTDTGKAVSFLKELVAVNPDDVFLRQRLAISYLKDNRRQEAIGEYDTLAEIQYNTGMKKQAIQTLQTILKLKPENPDGYKQVIEQIRSGEM